DALLRCLPIANRLPGDLAIPRALRESHGPPLASRLRGRRHVKRLVISAGFCFALVTLYVVVVRPWQAQWGATAAEVSMIAPGDHLMAPGAKKSTRAITIHAPPRIVWAWLIQLGQGRGGWYSHDWLENLFAAGMNNVEE